MRHVPDMRLNLLSMHAFDVVGYESYFVNVGRKLTKGSMTFARGKICYVLYKIHIKVCNESNATKVDSLPYLWHK